MALQFRRGTDAERQQFEFAEGEPVYVTDTGELYIGDGETQGGQPIISTLSQESDPELGGNLDLNENNITGIGNIAIDGNIGGPGPGTSLSLGTSLDLNSYNIIGQGNINIDGSIQATGVINIGAGADDNIIVGGEISSSLIPADDRAYDLGSNVSAWRNGFFEGLEVNGSISADNISVIGDIYADDSALVFESLTQTFFTNLQGNVLAQNSQVMIDADTGNINAIDIFAETVTADLTGSVFAEDSGIIVNSQTGDINATDIFASLVLSDLQGSVLANDNTLLLSSVTKSLLIDTIESNVSIVTPTISVADDDNLPLYALVRNSDTDLTDEPFKLYGEIAFERNDVNGIASTAFINGGLNFITFGAATQGGDPTTGDGFFDERNRVTFFDQQLGIGIADPGATLDVNGSAIVRGNIEASAFKGTVVGDDSTVLIDAVDNTITSGGFVQFGSYTDTDRPDGVNGMVIYNSTSERFQGYQNGAWINLDDGSSA
jgi:hypothetical protein